MDEELIKKKKVQEEEHKKSISFKRLQEREAKEARWIEMREKWEMERKMREEEADRKKIESDR